MFYCRMTSPPTLLPLFLLLLLLFCPQYLLRICYVQGPVLRAGNSTMKADISALVEVELMAL